MAVIIVMHAMCTLMSLECSDELKALIFQSQNVDLSAVVGYKHIVACLIVGHVCAPSLCLETAQFAARFGTAPLECLVTRATEYPIHLWHEKQGCDPVTVC